jgi:type I restriction enzyme M protein
VIQRQKRFPNDLLKHFTNIPADTTGDLFEQIYEYFLAEFARSEGQKGGEFLRRHCSTFDGGDNRTHGEKVFDPACGCGGMFVQSAKSIDEHRKELSTNGKSSGIRLRSGEQLS